MAQSKIFSYQSWVHAVAGATGSVVAMTTFYPLDTVRYRLQVEDPEKRKALNTWRLLLQLISEEGFETLYRGIVPVLQSLCISNFVYFYTFHGLKALKNGSNKIGGGSGQNALRDLFLGTIAGIINVLTTTPFWVVNTRLKMKGINKNNNNNNNNSNNNNNNYYNINNNINNSNLNNERGDGGIGSSNAANKNPKEYSNLLDGLLYIARTEGMYGLWSGTLPSLLLVINPALQFMMYEYLKRKVQGISTFKSSGLTFFFIGAIAKTFATVLTYPLQLIQTKLRHGINDNKCMQQLGDLPKSAGIFDMLIHIIKKQGFVGLFRGLEAKLWQTVLTAALMFATYEKIAKFVMSLLIRQQRNKKH